MSDNNSQCPPSNNRRKPFRCARQGEWERLKKSATLDDAGRAVGTIGVSHCVGMYIELGDAYCCWHIECIPMVDCEFVDLVGSADFKKVSKVIEGKLNNEVGNPSAQEVKETLIIICSSPDYGSMAMIDGILQWAGLKAETDKAAFRLSERYKIHRAHGFIVEEPGDMTSIQWLEYEEGEQSWDAYWENVACGEPDGMPEIMSTREQSQLEQEGDERELEVRQSSADALREDSKLI